MASHTQSPSACTTPTSIFLQPNLNSNGPLVTGTVNVVSNRGFTVEGYVQTSRGTVDTKVVQAIDFSNAQRHLVKNDALK